MTATREEIIDLIKDGGRYRRRRIRWAKFWGRVLATAILVPLNGFLLMMVIGIAHHEWWPTVPTIGFTWATWLAVLMRLIFVDPLAKDLKP